MNFLGVWIDDSAKDVVTAAYWDSVQEHGFTTAAIMLESSNEGFDPKYSLETLRKIKELALKRDIEIVLTIWPEPSKKYMAEFEQKIGDYLSASGASGLEFDCEGNWLKSKVQGYSTLDVAATEFIEIFDRVSNAHDVRIELTTYPYHHENSLGAKISPRCNRLLPQAYSVRNRPEGEVSWDDRLGPGKMQRLTIDRALQVPGVGGVFGPLVCCGLAAYDQDWPGKTEEQAMRLAFDTAVAYNPLEIRFWSSKWIFGARSNGYSSRFIKSLKGST